MPFRRSGIATAGSQRRADVRRARHWLARIFGLLVFCWVGALIGVAMLGILYQKKLAGDDIVRQWLKYQGGGKYVVVSHQELANKNVLIAYADALADPANPNRDLRTEIDLARSNLSTLLPPSKPALFLAKHPTYAEAIDATQRFLELADQAATSGPHTVTLTRMHDAHDKADRSLARLEVEGLDEEAEIRDGMVSTVKISLSVASYALPISAALLCLGLLSLVAVFYADRARAKAENIRFNELERLLATVSHDLRSPLQAILGSARLMEAPVTEFQRRGHVRVILEATEQLRRLVDDLVDLGRLDNQQMTLAPSPFSLPEWVAAIAEGFRPQAERKGLFFTVRSKNLPEAIEFDRTRLSQMMSNLLSNALKFTERGGIEFYVKYVSDPEVTSSGRLEISVKDTGQGIAPADQTRIFHPFVQLPPNDGPREGMGMGLAIVQRLVKLAGGSVRVASTLGKGSTFSLSLPAREVELPPARVERPLAIPVQPQLGLKRILLVDDDPRIRFVLGEIVQSMGFACDTASNGQAGLEMAQPGRYAAVLTDIQMPDMDGFAFAHALREQPAPRAAIIAVTAYTNSLQHDARASVFDRVLSKPVDRDELLDTLEALVDNTAPPAPAASDVLLGK